MSAMPNDVRDALLSSAKRWLLSNYVGGRKKLEPWSDHYAGLTSINSFSLPGNRAKNLRRLIKLAADGVLVETPTGSRVRRFTAPRQVLDEIGQQAVREWEAAGYRVGEMMDEITLLEGGVK